MPLQMDACHSCRPLGLFFIAAPLNWCNASKWNKNMLSHSNCISFAAIRNKSLLSRLYETPAVIHSHHHPRDWFFNTVTTARNTERRERNSAISSTTDEIRDKSIYRMYTHLIFQFEQFRNLSIADCETAIAQCQATDNRNRK